MYFQNDLLLDQSYLIDHINKFYKMESQLFLFFFFMNKN